MSSIIKIKRSSTPGAVPANNSLQAGELAINLSDKKLYSSSNGTNIITISGDQYNLSSSGNTSVATLNLTVDNAALSNDAINIIGDDTITVSYLSGNSDILIAADNTLVKTISANTGTATGSSHGVSIVSGTATGIGVTATGDTVTIAGLDATNAVKGVAMFDANAFAISEGNVSLADSATGAVLSISGTTSEVNVSRTDGTVTIGLPDDVSITAQLNVGENIVVSGNASIGGSLDVSGDLNVTGAITYISSSTVSADDSMLKLAANNAADVVDVGLYGMYVDGVTSKYAGWFRDASDGVFKFYTGLQDEPTTTVNVSGTGFAQGQLDAIIDGGTY